MGEPAPKTVRLTDPLTSLPGIGAKRAEVFAALGLSSINDLLLHFPWKYEDRTSVIPIANLYEGDSATIFAELVSIKSRRLRGRKTLAEAVLRDETGEVRATWFNQGYLARALTPGKWGYFTGDVGKYNGLCFKSPEYEFLTGDDDDALHANRIVPIYRTGEGVGQRLIRSLIHRALTECANEVGDTLPEGLAERMQYSPVHEAIWTVHFPEDMEAVRPARDRFAFEELLRLQIDLIERRKKRQEAGGIAHRVGGPVYKQLRDALPFKLTGAQEKATAAVLEDMAADRPMARLLQGDVGCGKTVVAMHAIAAAADGDYQTAVMAPTAILAEQHYLNLKEALAPLGLRVLLLTGATKGANQIRDAIATGYAQVVVGTHALIQESTDFHNLGLVIVDEQHRFGVMQREALRKKSHMPDVLQMTATPIPRTLALTVYGAMDLTIIDELPPGRTPVKTRHIKPNKVADMHQYIRDECAKGRQVYYVCPLVEDSDKVDLTAVTTHFEELSQTEFNDQRTALLHGRMPADEKEAIMRAFKAGGADILFATTVIEVGVDVPNATIMVIENADQFGMTQLHQLRGRVGRGAQESFCFLLGKPRTKDGKKRIDTMCKTTDGFVIAEADLELRGPGEFYGVRQAGLTDMRIADLLRDARLIDLAREEAEKVVR